MQKRKEVKKRKVEGYVCGGEKTKGKKGKKKKERKRNVVRLWRIKKRGKKRKKKKKKKRVSQYFHNTFPINFKW